MTDLAQPHDRFLKALLSTPETAGTLLRERLPKEVAEMLSPDPPELVDGSFVDEELRTHLTDSRCWIWGGSTTAPCPSNPGCGRGCWWPSTPPGMAGNSPPGTFWPRPWRRRRRIFRFFCVMWWRPFGATTNGRCARSFGG
ncbi:MAG: Rpn family recombination-promoting nuclease/putative transposase, partial [Magnetococcales bacterium]|nr:Rpn family recombination-promoting nuclease/putative transposase [Magnetococcales bacterium]